VSDYKWVMIPVGTEK